jgi:hypothetical protein
MPQSYQDYCRICYSRYTVDHACLVSGSVIKNSDLFNKDKYRGAIRDNSGYVWTSEVLRHTTEEAQIDADLHLRLHQIGECRCHYIIPPIPNELRSSDKATIYIIKNDKLRSYKIGVSANSRGERVGQHTSGGWEIVGIWTHINGSAAYNIEQEHLREWRTRGCFPSVHPSQMPQGGYSETISYDDLSPEEMNRIKRDIDERVP